MTAAVSTDGTPRIMEVRAGRAVVKPLQGSDDPLATRGGIAEAGAGALAIDYSAEFSPDGQRVLVRSSGLLRVWEFRQPVPLKLLADHVLSTTFLEGDEARVTSFVPNAVKPGAIRIVDFRTKSVLATFDLSKLNLEGVPKDARLTADGKLIRVVARDKNSEEFVALTLDARTGEPRNRVTLTTTGTGKTARQPTFTRDGGQIVAYWQDKPQLWKGLPPRLAGQAGQEGTTSAQVSEDGTALLTSTICATAYTIQLWDSKTGRPIGHSLRMDGTPVKYIDIGPGGQHILIALAGELQLWDVARGKRLCSLSTGEFIASFSPLGDRFVAPTPESGLQTWDAQTCRALGEPLPEEAGVLVARFSPDGSRLLTFAKSGAIRIWDLPLGSDDDGRSLADVAEEIGGMTVDEEGSIGLREAPRVHIDRLCRSLPAAQTSGNSAMSTVMDWLRANSWRCALALGSSSSAISKLAEPVAGPQSPASGTTRQPPRPAAIRQPRT